MFESATLTAAPASTRLWSTCAGISGQVLIVGVMLLAPLISPAVLPNLRSYVTLAPPGPPPPPPPAGGVTVRPRTVVTHKVCTLCAPSVVPNHPPVIIVDDEPLPTISDPNGVIGGVKGGSKDGVVGSNFLDGILKAGAPPPAQRPVEQAAVVKPPAAAPIQRIRAGGLVQLAAPIFHPDPIYPAIAKTSHVEGVVELEGIIGTDGRIHNLRVLKGHPFLVKAATDAVLKWVYKPATLNGDLVEVIAPITVTFRLGGY
jgi:periplasmic protein TonB